MKETNEILKITGITKVMFHRYKNMGLVDNFAEKRSTPGKFRGGFRYFYDDRVIDQIKAIKKGLEQGISLEKQQGTKKLKDYISAPEDIKLLKAWAKNPNIIGHNPNWKKEAEQQPAVREILEHLAPLKELLAKADDGVRGKLLSVIEEFLSQENEPAQITKQEKNK